MDHEYDVIIIGAGIGGLVAANYLSSNGLAVALFEQHHQPGGYCTSFRRGNFRFDVGVHYIGAVNKGGALGEVLEELDLRKTMRFVSVSRPYRFFLKDQFTADIFSGDDSRTLKNFQKIFPDEKENLIRFFLFLKEDFYHHLSKLRQASFQEILNAFFKDRILKLCFNALLGNIGIPASRASALAGAILFREYIFNDSVYPKGGMSVFPQTLCERAKGCGVHIYFSTLVKKVIVEHGSAKGVLLADGRKFFARSVISNADPYQIFHHLPSQYSNTRKTLNNYEVSPSIFMVYLGLNSRPNAEILKSNCSIIINVTSFTKDFLVSSNGGDCHAVPLMAVSNPSFFDADRNSSGSSLAMLVFAKYASERFWRSARRTLAETMIDQLKSHVRFLENDISIKIDATPRTFFRYTQNRHGSAYGWASTVNQVKSNIWPSASVIKDLFFVGHWSTGCVWRGGIPGAAYSGREVAKYILTKFSKKWPYKLIKI